MAKDIVICCDAYISVSARFNPTFQWVQCWGCWTGLAAIFVDKYKESTSQAQRNPLVAEQAALNSRIAELSSTSMTPGSAVELELAQKKSRRAEVEATIAQLPTVSDPAITKSFVQAILHDGDSISLHRFQIAIWTLVLGMVFVWAVYRNISMVVSAVNVSVSRD
jgi:hypothetical protein